MFKMSFDTDNAAFQDDNNCAEETARILEDLATKIRNGESTGLFQPVRDVNGNMVGTWKLHPDESR